MNISETQNELLNAALEYFEMGLCPIPIGQSDDGQFKKPLQQWRTYQNVLPKREQIIEWFSKDNIKGIGILTGKFYKIVVLDFDTDYKDINQELYPIPDTPTVISGRNGLHAYFKISNDFVFPSTKLIPKYLDIRGEGGLIIVPPSMHQSGNKYTWLNKIDAFPFADFPSWAYPLLAKQKSEKNSANIIDSNLVHEGSRNITATKVLGTLLSKTPKAQWESLAWVELKNWNTAKCIPPLEESELRTTFNSISRLENSKLLNTEQQLTISDLSEAISFKDLLNTEFDDVTWAIEGLIPKEGITILSSSPGLYKSYLLSLIAICVATGNKFLDHFNVTQCGVMIVDEENPERRLKTRILQLTEEKELPIYFHVMSGFQLTTNGMVESLIKECVEKNIKFVMFDTFIRIHGLDENKSSDMNQLYQELKKFKINNITVLIAHHHKKQGIVRAKPSDSSGLSEVMRGSSDILGMIDSHLSIAGYVKEEDGNYLIAAQPKLRESMAVNPFKIGIISDKLKDKILFTYEGEYEEGIKKVDQAKDEILKLLSSDVGGLSLKEIEKYVESIAKSATVRQALNILKKTQQIISKTRASLKAAGSSPGDGNGSTIFYFINPVIQRENIMNTSPVLSGPEGY